MRLEATKKEDEYKVWLTNPELDELRRAAASHRNDLIIQFGEWDSFTAIESYLNVPDARRGKHCF